MPEPPTLDPQAIMEAWLALLLASYDHTVSADGHTHTYTPREDSTDNLNVVSVVSVEAP